MAAATATQIFQNGVKSEKSNTEVSRDEIQAAIAKAVELRALHAALVQGNSPVNGRYPSSSPVSANHVSPFSAQDYPVFTPSYEDEPLAPFQIQPNNYRSQSWDDYGLSQGGNTIENVLSNNIKKEISFSPGLDSHNCPADDQKSVTGSCTNHFTVLQTSPAAEFYRSSRRNSLGDFKSISSSSCNRCKPAIITSESENITSRAIRSSNLVVPLTDSHHSTVQHSQRKNKGVVSWLFPRFKKKNNKSEVGSPNRAESEEVSQVLKDLGIMSIEKLKRELIEAKENRDAALMEVAEMKSSLGELKQKLEYLETYCEDLKKALKQAKDFPKSGTANCTNGNNIENLMPVSEDVMVEGFLQIVSEARLSVKQFSKTLIMQIEESDDTLVDNLNTLLQPYKLSVSSRYSKVVLYHLEAIINQTLYQDFENCVFQKNGSPKILDPQHDRQARFSSFVALRNLSWNEVLRKGTKYYSEEFSKFCDQKMNCIITTLNWTRPWPEQLLQAFFVSAKCIWLLHLLAFSFNPPLGILRVEENRSFDPHYMDDIFMDRQRSQGPSRVKIMVIPGFYVQDRVLRCKVICRYKSVA